MYFDWLPLQVRALGALGLDVGWPARHDDLLRRTTRAASRDGNTRQEVCGEADAGLRGARGLSTGTLRVRDFTDDTRAAARRERGLPL